MKKIFAQGDLSGWLSPDEELLLNLFRESGSYEREQMLFQYALKRLACMFADETDSLGASKGSNAKYKDLAYV